MEIIKLNLIPNGVNPTCHCSQYDNGRVIRIDLFDGLTPYVLQSGDTVTLNVRKPDNTIVTASVTATQGNTYVNLVTTEQMCACVGYNLCDLTITNGSVVIGTLNFIMQVERDVLADGIPSQSVIEDLDALVQEAVGDNYYTKTEVDDALALKANSADVYTKSETDTALSAKANASGLDAEINARKFYDKGIYDGYIYNPDNIFDDVFLDNSIVLDNTNASVETGEPSGVIFMSGHVNNPVASDALIKLPLGAYFDNLSSDNYGTYYVHMTIRGLRNADYAYKTPSINCYCYNNTLKRSFTFGFDTPASSPDANTYKSYTNSITIDASNPAFNELRLGLPIGFDVYIKDFYITYGEDSTPLYKLVVDEAKVIELIQETTPTPTNNFKLAIIGDSLSAPSEVVKYHEILKNDYGYNVVNVAVSGAGYTNGSLQGGTRDHYFYNQALNIPTDTDGTLVFGSFNDMSLLGGRFYIYNSSNQVVSDGAAGKAPSSTATLLSTDTENTHYAIHNNGNTELAAGTYCIEFGGEKYQFTTSVACEANGKIVLRVVTLGEIGTDDNDLDTIVGAFTSMINNIYARNNGMIIGIVSPTPWILYNRVSPISAAGLTNALAYIDKLKELSTHYQLPFMNLFDESNLRPWNTDFKTAYYNNADGVHPNSDGHEKFIMPHMRQFIKTWNFKRI